MRKYRIIVTLVVCLACSGSAGAQPRTVIPAKSALKKFMPSLHEEKLAEAKAGTIDFVMIGDSITHGWSRHPGVLKVGKMLNLGFPGDRTQNVLWRLQHGAVDGISPRLVTLMIGTNHAHEPRKGHTPDTPEDIFTGIEAVVAELRTRLPKAKIIVFSVFPRKPGGANDRVNAVNAMLPRISDGRHVFHADINRTFLDDQGSDNAALYNRDGLHLNAAGYAAWAKALQPLLEKERLKNVPDVPVAGAKPLVSGATESQWHGYTRQNFTFKGHRCFITQPKTALPSKPWVWRAKFPGYHDEIDKILVEQGFHIAHINCGAMLGSPKARDLWDAFYTYVTETAGLSKRVALEAVSRGGLYAYGWAERNPEKVTCIYGDVPVLDFRSWPGGKGKGIGSEGQWKNLQKQYGFTEAQAMNSEDIPLNKLEPLAKAGIPIMHVISPVDRVVPAEENSRILEKKYRALGGSVIVLPNQKGDYSCNGHHFPLDDPQRCANFILDNTPLPPLAGSRPNPSTSLRARRPSIIVVLTDDQGMGDLSCMGNPILRTPHLDRFYEQATRFTDFHVSPTCSPSRAAIMSGRFPFEVGVSHTIMQRDRLAPDVVTFPQALQEAGYKTGLFGKWHLGDGDPYLPQNRGFNEVLMHGAGGIGQYGFGDFQENAKNKYFDNVLLHNDTIVKTKGFCTDLFFNAALGWMRKQYDAKQPFFAYISLNAPHGPLIAPEDYKKRFLDEGYDQSTAGRYGMIENIDNNMGVLMGTLEEWQVLDSTLVVFMTDNGMAMKSIGKEGHKGRIIPCNAGLRGHKDTNWEGGTHVPAFWYWKGVLDEGVDIPALTAHIDLYRTFCALAAAEIPQSALPPKGRSLLPLLEDPKAEWPDRTLFSHRGRWGGGGRGKKTRALAKYHGASVRTERWRLVFEMDSKGPWLSDVSNDPGETKNLVVEFPEVAEQLKAEFDQWWESTEAFLVNEGLPRIRAGEHHLQLLYNKQLEEKGIPDWEPDQY